MIPKIVQRWMAENPIHTVAAKSDTRPRCAMCGAVEGIVHHDPPRGYGNVIVKLRRSRLRSQLECQPCNAGMAELRRDQRRKAVQS